MKHRDIVMLRFNALLENAIFKGSPPDRRKSHRSDHDDYSDTQTPSYTSKGAASKRGRASRGSKVSSVPKSSQSS